MSALANGQFFSLFGSTGVCLRTAGSQGVHCLPGKHLPHWIASWTKPVPVPFTFASHRLPIWLWRRFCTTPRFSAIIVCTPLSSCLTTSICLRLLRCLLPQLMKSLKGITAKRANPMLALTGRPFWQEESYDHIVRHEREFENIRNYIEENPVRAGLVGQASKYCWSSAGWATRGSPADPGVRPTFVSRSIPQ